MRYPVFGEKDFKSVPFDAEEIHLVRPLKLESLEKLLKSKKNIKAIFFGKSTKARLGKKAKDFLKKKKIRLTQERKAGRAISINLRKVQELVELHKDYRSFRKIEDLTGIPKSTAHYLIKYAKRAKIKSGNNVVYL